MNFHELVTKCILLDKDMNLLYPEYPDRDEEETINDNS